MKIAQLGTFDVENYGDLLFPTLAEKRLRSRIPELTLDPVSPVGRAPVWKDCSSSIGYDDFSGKRQDYHGFLVGGGNIIRVTPSSLKTYNKDAIPILGYANLWAGVAAENDDKGPPICWNAPGVPSSFPSSLQPLLRACLERVDYVSVRDEISRDFLWEVAPDIAISVVPDSVWEIDRLWKRKALDAAYRKAFVSREAAVPDRSVAIHVNARYLGGATIEEVATHLDNLCRVLQAKGVLIAIGPCHGDDELARRIAECMETGPLAIDRPASLKEIAACIARSAAYVGSSMHGFITASSFCVPAVVVASPRMVKFPGLLSQIGMPNLLHQTWPEAIEHVMGFASTDHVQTLQRVRADQQTRLDEHWSKITAFFQDSRRPLLHQPDTARAVSLPRGTSGLRYRESVLGTTAIETFAENQVLRERERKREARVGELEKKLRTVDEAADRRIAKLERALERGAEVERLGDAVKAAEQALSERGARVSELEGALAERRVETKRLTVDLEAARSTLSERDVEIEKLSGTLSERDADVERFGDEVKAAEQALSERGARVSELEGALAERRVETKRLTGELEAAQNALSERGTEIDRLSAALGERDGRIGELSAALGDRKTELERLTGETETARAELAARAAELEAAIGSRDAEIERLTGEATEHRQTAERLEGELSARTARVTELEGELSARAARVSELERTLAWRDAEAGRLSAENAALKSSVSWRMTAPLRAAAKHASLRSRKKKKRRRLRLQKDARLISSSGLFDAGWYLKQNPDVAEAGIDPLKHYLHFGAAEGRNPNPLFDTLWYLNQNLDVAEARMNPLVHYLRHGAAEGRDPSPFFDSRTYIASNPDVAATNINPLLHYIRFGAREGRYQQPSAAVEFIERLAIEPDLIGRLGEAGRQIAIKYYSKTMYSDALKQAYRFILGRQDAALSTVSRAVGSPPSHTKSEPQVLELEGALLERTAETAAQAGVDGMATLDFAAVVKRLQNNQEPPAIVIPIYNAPDEVEACLNSVLSHTGKECRILVIDDASPDPDVRQILAKFRGTTPIELYANHTNLGFTRTVNLGIELAGRSDVIFLNADTRVTPGWLRNLRIAAYSGEKVGTATPFSNNAGAFSAPEIGKANDIPAWMGLEAYGRAISQVSRRCYATVPTGNGFCMYVRRDCIDETGLLDAKAFPRGYGEENDFCMRAGLLGWSHVIDDATLIYHSRSASFGNAKRHLMKRGREVIDQRYPNYTAAVRNFVGDQRLKAARERIWAVGTANTAGKSSVKPRVLFVLSTKTGGTPATNEDLMTALDDRVESFVLRCNAKAITLMHFNGGVYNEMERYTLTQPLEAFPHRSTEYDAIVAQWLVRYAIELVHIRHIAWHGLGLIDVAKAINLPVVFSFHDFYTVCPTVNLLDGHHVFCGGTCTATGGECRQPLWSDTEFPPLKHAAIYQWRRQFSTVLAKCDAFVTTADSAKNVLVGSYPFLANADFRVIPHGRNFERFDDAAEPFTRGSVLRVLIPGNISFSKGGEIIADLGRVAAKNRLEIHVLGKVSPEIKLSKSVIVHGAYSRGEFGEKVRAIKPHVGAVLSICSETYCHALTELWASGVPVIGFDIGAVGDRIRQTGAGWLATEPTANGVLTITERLHAQPEQLVEKTRSVRDWQNGLGRLHDCQHMSHGYFDIYRSLLTGLMASTDRRPNIAVLAPGAQLENYQIKAAPGSTHVRLGEKTKDSLYRTVRYDFCDASSDPDWLTSRYDGILVQRTALTPVQATELIRLCSLRNRPIIYEIDDDLIERAKLPEENTDYGECSSSVEQLVHAASLVVTSTETLRNRIAPLNLKVLVEPNAISARLWLGPLAQESSGPFDREVAKKSEAEFRVVYMGNKTHAADLALLREVFENVRKVIPKVRLFTIGVTEEGDDWYESIAVPNDRKNYPEFVMWVRPILGTMNIAVAPLADTHFNRAKSDLKFIEYAAAKLPCIASNVTPYCQSVKHGKTGLLAENTTDSWAENLLFAATNLVAIAKLADEAYAEVVANRLLCDRETALDAAVHSIFSSNGIP